MTRGIIYMLPRSPYPLYVVFGIEAPSFNSIVYVLVFGIVQSGGGASLQVGLSAGCGAPTRVFGAFNGRSAADSICFYARMELRNTQTNPDKNSAELFCRAKIFLNLPPDF